MEGQLFQIGSLRGQFAPFFAEWDASCRTSDTVRARAARAALRSAVFPPLEAGVALRSGIYVFVDARASGASSILYVGIANTERRPIGVRIKDRLRDDSCLDSSLDGLGEGERRERVTQRLTVALPRSGRNYVDKHLRACDLFRQATYVLMVAPGEGLELLRQVERALIGSAAAAGARLFNRQHVKFRGGISPEVSDLGVRIIGSVQSAGLDMAAAKEWQRGIVALAA